MITIGEILNALKGSCLSSMSPAERRETFERISRSTLALSGYTIADGIEDMAKPIADILYNRVYERYPGLRDKEIELALQGGIMGEWTKTRVPTAANVGTWVEAYIKSDIHRDAMKQVAAKARSLNSGVSEELKAEMNDKARRDAALKAWEDFKTTGKLDIFLDGYAVMIYDYLANCGVLKPSRETIEQAFRASRAKADSNAFARIGETADKSYRGDWRTKRELLSMFFKYLRESGKELRITV